MIIKTDKRDEAIHAIINVWLKDKTPYCNNCNENYPGEYFPCCENPQVGRNMDHCRGLINQNKEFQKTRLNSYASTADKTLRWGASLPPRLYLYLNSYCKENGEDGLFNEKYDVIWFAKKFPQFAIPERL